jgi:hypothetical protein
MVFDTQFKPRLHFEMGNKYSYADTGLFVVDIFSVLKSVTLMHTLFLEEASAIS